MNTKKIWKMFLVVAITSFFVGILLNVLSLPGFIIGIVLAIFTIVGTYLFKLNFKKASALVNAVIWISVPYYGWGKTGEFKNIILSYTGVFITFAGFYFLYQLVCLNDYKEKPETDPEGEES